MQESAYFIYCSLPVNAGPDEASHTLKGNVGSGGTFEEELGNPVCKAFVFHFYNDLAGAGVSPGEIIIFPEYII